MNERWPAVRKRSAPEGLDLLQDESGVSQRPSIRRTWPERRNAVLIHALTVEDVDLRGDWLSLGCRRSRLFFQTREGSYNTESLIAFLNDLKRTCAIRKPSWRGTDYPPTKAAP